MVSRTEKFRGRRTHGRGHKSGRGAGIRGGRGNAGLLKHKFMYVNLNMPNHFGRHGFKRPQSVVSSNVVINVNDIEEKLHDYLKSGIATQDGDIYKVNLTELGYDKLLGTGRINVPVEITVSSASPGAVKKIEAAGGKVITE